MLRQLSQRLPNKTILDVTKIAGNHSQIIFIMETREKASESAAMLETLCFELHANGNTLKGSQ